MSKGQKAESCPEFATQDQITEAQKQKTEMNKSNVQQSTNPELQTQDSTQLINFIEQWSEQQNEM